MRLQCGRWPVPVSMFQCFNMISHAKFEVLPRPFFVSIITWVKLDTRIGRSLQEHVWVWWKNWNHCTRQDSVDSREGHEKASLLNSFPVQKICDLYIWIHHAIRHESVSESLVGVSHCFKTALQDGVSVFRHVFLQRFNGSIPTTVAKVWLVRGEAYGIQAPTWSTFNATGFEYLYLLKADYEKLPPGSVEATWFWVEMFFFFGKERHMVALLIRLSGVYRGCFV